MLNVIGSHWHLVKSIIAIIIIILIILFVFVVFDDKTLGGRRRFFGRQV